MAQKRRFHTLSPLCLAALVAGCNETKAPGEPNTASLATYQRQIQDLTTERDQLKAQVLELSRTPSAILADVSKALTANDVGKAVQALQELENRFPKAVEIADGKKQIVDHREAIAKAEVEKQRLASLGFKALPFALTLKGTVVTSKYNDMSFNSRYLFDRYEDSFHYYDADRNTKYAVMNVSVTAGKDDRNPDMPGTALYWADGATLRKIGDFDIRFARWESFATYLGNYSDSRNDFAKVQTIPFVLGVQVSDDLAKKRPLYVVATKSGCISRGYARFKQPPDYYSGECSALKSTLELDDFTNPSSGLSVVLRRD